MERLRQAASDAGGCLFPVELALETRAEQLPLSPIEGVVLAVCAWVRELDGGGYEAFLLNASRVHASGIVDALARIGCHDLAAITADALAAVTAASLPDQAGIDDLAARRALAACDARREACPEDPVTSLLDWMATYADAILVPPCSGQ